MPHPERYIHLTQHPTWTRRREQVEPDGCRLFANAVAYYDG
jgi:phosphoribosylformylglycinamidine synthase